MEKTSSISEQNTKEINQLKDQYQGIGPLLHELNHEIFEIIEEVDSDDNKELFEHLVKVSRMADILEGRLREKNVDMIERVTVKYLFDKLKLHLSACNPDALSCKDNNTTLFSRNDISHEIERLMDEMNYIA